MRDDGLPNLNCSIHVIVLDYESFSAIFTIEFTTFTSLVGYLILVHGHMWTEVSFKACSHHDLACLMGLLFSA